MAFRECGDTVLWSCKNEAIHFRNLSDQLCRTPPDLADELLISHKSFTFEALGNEIIKTAFAGNGSIRLAPPRDGRSGRRSGNLLKWQLECVNAHVVPSIDRITVSWFLHQLPMEIVLSRRQEIDIDAKPNKRQHKRIIQPHERNTELIPSFLS